MNRLTFIILFSICLHGMNCLQAKVNVAVSAVQTKDKYIKVKVHKYDPAQMDLLLASLHAHPDKITRATFNEPNGHLIIYYTDAVLLADVYEMIKQYIPSFDRVSGSEL